MDAGIQGWMKRWMDGLTHEWIDGWTHMNGGMDGGMDGGINGWMDVLSMQATIWTMKY